MEVALVSAGTGALKSVLEKLAALMGDEYKRFKGVRKDIKYLTHELTAMDAFLMMMSEEEDPDVQDKVWMNEVRELSYDMECCIDTFIKHVDDKDSQPVGLIEKIRHSVGKIMALHRIGTDIHDLKNQIVQVGERNQRYKTGYYISSRKNAIVDPRSLAMFEDVSKLVGIDEPKAEIVRLLTEGALTKEQPKLVSIVGSGGMGKTTLANQVYQQLKGEFKYRAFLSVSRNPDMMNILRTIFSEVTGKDYAKSEAGSIEQIIRKITEFLAKERYFVVVDDIWDVDTWDVIKLAFPITTHGSVIITTTRINDVAKSCCSSFSGDIYGIRPLNVVHSRQLFHRRLFDSNEGCPPHLKNVSDEILRKCDGLPLAVIAISGLLAHRERTEDVWNQVNDSIGRALERNHGVKRMMRILSLSYFDLPPHLKTCFLYMSIFPEDYTIRRDYLIRLWIYEGFIHKEDRYTVHEIGEMCFNELINRSLIQPMRTDYTGKVVNCQIHDTILDFIISRAIEENFVTFVGDPILKTRTKSKVVRRLSIQVSQQENSTIRESGPILSHVRSRLSIQVSQQGNSTIRESGLILSHVRSLNVFGTTVEIPSLEQCRHLCVLDLHSCSQLEEHHLKRIVGLFQLRYLDLSQTGISELPEQIGRLRLLEFLNLRFNKVQELPTSIVNLGKLSHLFVDSGVIFPGTIWKMQALYMLISVKVYRQSLNFLLGLAQLKNLSYLTLDFKVDVGYLGVDEKWNKAIFASLCELHTGNLRSLYISEGGSFLQKPLCMVTLEKLITSSSVVPRLPSWVSSLRNLQQINLQLERVRQADLCVLGALPALQILYLKVEENSSRIHRISGEVGFRFLRIFIYDPNGLSGELMFATGSMPKLEILWFENFGVHGAESVEFGIENLPCLISVMCEVRGYPHIVEAGKTAMQRATSTHPNHPTLHFTQST